MRRTLTAAAVSLAALAAAAAPAHAATAPHVTAETGVSPTVVKQGKPATITAHITGKVTGVRVQVTDGFVWRTVALKHVRGATYSGRFTMPAVPTSGVWDTETTTGVVAGKRINLDPQWLGVHGFIVTGPLSLGGR